MPKQPLFITTAVSGTIVCILRAGLFIGKTNWSTKELIDEIKMIYGNNVADNKIRHILEEYQGGEFTS